KSSSLRFNQSEGKHKMEIRTLTNNLMADQPPHPERIVKDRQDPSQSAVPQANITTKTKRVVVVSGYGMALAQAQSEVKHIADLMRQNGKDVKFGVYPVAGRISGHMYVLLTEVEMPCEKEYGMKAINSEFNDPDLIVVVGSTDFFNTFPQFSHQSPYKKNLPEPILLLND
ncbi:MAG: NAD(P)(+) transhydrogenase (Re/Si-specific) subunit beta, partial [Desulfococcus multivorans]|nr:NAD(P)(+) transhydrogenase (Re/Si-specific) subunit beta [Desulfococcus multivorans]